MALKLTPCYFKDKHKLYLEITVTPKIIPQFYIFRCSYTLCKQSFKVNARDLKELLRS